MNSNNSARDDGSMRVVREQLTLRERAAGMLRNAIITHRFPPGTHLKERELCELLGVSRTSVREALRHLESERLIKTVPHKGPVVVSLTAQDAQDLYQVRAALEGLAGELFAANADNRHISELQETATLMAIAAGKNNPEETLDIINKFYTILFEGSGNLVCAQFVQSLNARISMFRRMTLFSKGRSNAMMSEIDDIVNAAVTRDAARLKQACIAHVQGACAALLLQLTNAQNENFNTTK
jgi:DNA-binding GntR family transcriptional regulator